MIIFYRQSLLLLPQTFQLNLQYLVLWLRLTKVVLQEMIVALGFVPKVNDRTVCAILIPQQRKPQLHPQLLPRFRHLLLNLLEVALQSSQVVLKMVNAALIIARKTVHAIRDHTSNPHSGIVQ